MGNKTSTVFPCMQPSLTCSSFYDQLPSPSHTDYQELLLEKEDHHEVFNTHESILKCMMQLKREIEANRKKNESLEKKNKALEKELREVRTTISKLDSKVPSVVEKNVAALEEEIRVLKSAISRLESRSRPATPVPGLIASDAAAEKEDAELTDQQWRIQKWLQTEDEFDHVVSCSLQKMVENN